MSPADPATLPDLSARDGLPDALRLLLTDFPRERWSGHPNSQGLVDFWLRRHLLFRRMLGLLTDASQQRLDHRIEPRSYAQTLSHQASRFISELHGHHQIEDQHYFPLLMRQDRRLEQAFQLLDGDHHQLHGELDALVAACQAVLQPPLAADAEVGRLLERLQRFDCFLDRHLTDEEDVVVPIVLKYGPFE